MGIKLLITGIYTRFLFFFGCQCLRIFRKLFHSNYLGEICHKDVQFIVPVRIHFTHTLLQLYIISGLESHLSGCFRLFAPQFWKVLGTYE